MKKRTKYIILGFIVAILGVLLFLTLQSKAEASIQLPKVDICHYDGQSGNFQTLNIAVPSAIAHIAQHEEDYAGACVEIVDVCDNLEGIQEVTPDGYTNENGYCCPPEEEPTDYCETLEGVQAEDEDCPRECIPYNLAYVLDENEEYCEEEEEEPIPTPVPTPTPPSTDHINRAGTPPGECSAQLPGTPVNAHVWRKDGQAIVQYHTDGVSEMVNIYWLINGQDRWNYSLTTLNTGYVVINDLGTNDVTFGVAQYNKCKEGPIVTIVDGVDSSWQLFKP